MVGESKTNLTVLSVINCVVFSEESVTKDNSLSELSGESKLLESEHALSLTVCGNLNNVISSS